MTLATVEMFKEKASAPTYKADEKVETMVSKFLDTIFPHDGVESNTLKRLAFVDAIAVGDESSSSSGSESKPGSGSALVSPKCFEEIVTVLTIPSTDFGNQGAGSIVRQAATGAHGTLIHPLVMGATTTIVITKTSVQDFKVINDYCQEKEKASQDECLKFEVIDENLPGVNGPGSLAITVEAGGTEGGDHTTKRAIDAVPTFTYTPQRCDDENFGPTFNMAGKLQGLLQEALPGRKREQNLPGFWLVALKSYKFSGWVRQQTYPYVRSGIQTISEYTYAHMLSKAGSKAGIYQSGYFDFNKALSKAIEGLLKSFDVEMNKQVRHIVYL